jgi:hydrogenase-4 component B
VLWALAQHDLKRLLAYHSVENIGIILLGLGLGVLGTAYHHPVLALLGLAGALLHSLNHALFKSLLFLGAGVVVQVTGTREIDRLGGLARVVPRSAAAFLIGSLAIVGLPPLNGFVSEWLVFLGLLQAGATSGALRAASAVTAGLALTGALALACFTKLYGTVFLGLPRQAPAPERRTEAGLVSPQWVLAAACVAIGTLPGLVLPIATRVAGSVLGLSGESTSAVEAATPNRITLLALALAGVTAILWLLRQRRAARLPQGEAETWACAYPRVTSRMQYSASSYAASLLAAFGPLSGSQVVRHRGSLEVHGADPVIDRMGRPLWDRVQRAAFALRVLQTGRLRWYLLYLIFSLLALLLYLWATTT